jgi:hydrogenase nickel incorporation protein HypA/HybF
MHEVSIALNLIGIATDQCIKSGYNRIESINLKIGRASGIMPDALNFAFEAIKNDSIAAGAVLNIEEIPLTGHCDSCDNVFTAEEEYVLSCPACGGTSFKITAGRELDIIDMEVS